MVGSFFESGLSKLSSVFGTANERQLKKFQPIVDAVSALEPKYQGMSGEEMSAETVRLPRAAGRGRDSR